MKLFILAASALLAAVIVGGGGTLAQSGPPSVQPGTAAENCQRIVDAGYSPHDYIYSVLFFRQQQTLERHGSAGIDYYHYWYSYRGLSDLSYVLAFTVSGLTEEHGGLFSGGQVVHQEFTVTGEPGSYVASPKTGQLLEIDGGRSVHFAITRLFEGLGQGFDAYRWRPTGAPADGSGDIIYRDRQGNESVTITSTPSSIETQWIHDPDWEGAEGARMSSIWGDVAECSG